jgi:hypothetical protein
MITGFSIREEYVSSTYGTGLMLQLNTTSFKTTSLREPNSIIFQLAVGGQFGCAGCIGLQTENVLLVPISEILTGITNEATDLELLTQSVQDIISIDAECFSIRPTTRVNRSDSNIQMNIESFESGSSAVLLDIEMVSSVNFTGDVKSKRCSVVFRDWSGIPIVTYGISSTGVVSRLKVSSVSTKNAAGCTPIAGKCLHKSEIPNLADTVLTEALSSYLMTTNQVYSYALGLFPDPSDTTMTDEVYSERVAEILGMLLIMSTSKFNFSEGTVTVLSNSVAVRMNINSVPLILTIVFAILSILTSVVLIMIDIAKLGKTNDYLLRRLSQNIRAGKRHIEELSEYSRSVFKPGVEEWINAPVRFGEDRATASDALGRLRFGGKRDVVSAFLFRSIVGEI